MNLDREPKISVIVPVYRVEPYLEKCVRSILNQTCSNLEILLVDDGSPDRCGQLCDALAETDSRIQVIHKENGGLSSARNAGLDVCTGDYISFVDSDDSLEPDFYEALLSAIQETGADLALCDYQLVYEDGRPPVTESPFRAGVFSRDEALTLLAGPCCVRYVVAYNKLCPRRLFEGLRFPEGKLHEDEFLAHQLLGRCTTVAAIPRQLYCYLQRSGSIMNQGFNPRHIDKAQALLERYRYFQSLGRRDLCRETLCSCYTFLTEMLQDPAFPADGEFILPYLTETTRLLFREKNRRAISLLLITLRKFPRLRPARR